MHYFTSINTQILRIKHQYRNYVSVRLYVDLSKQCLRKLLYLKEKWNWKWDYKNSLYNVSDSKTTTNKHQLVHSSRSAMFLNMQCGWLSDKIVKTQNSKSKNNHLQHIELTEVSMH